ncbi:glucan endo-1,3-beta-glucosidase GII-like [Panicum virgatum]|uniref:glucan endo-1,3-beta-glucosidase GII-like n=1 Tax=Panicum virgatum TaxID=38727 RepID=UPI0019D6672B|nr:glucan endo-1,3-beta-glucosidase GII-like [Panicum virgatum]
MAARGVAPVFAAAMFVAAFAAAATSVRAIGVCYGVIGSGLPSKSDVVQLYKSNGIASMRFYFADQDLLTALRGSGIALALDVGNDKVGEFASDPAAAASWVRDNVQAYNQDVDIRYVVVGNEVPGAASVLQAMQNVHQLDDGEFRRRSGAAWRRSKREWRRGVLRARATCPDFDSSYLCSPPKQLHAATDGKQLRRHCQPTEV